MHRLAEERSLELHREVVRLLRRDPARVEEARERLREWQRRDLIAGPYARAWTALLDGPFEALCAALVDPSQHARDLRQNTPFTGFVDPRTRWKIWRDVRDRMEAVG